MLGVNFLLSLGLQELVRTMLRKQVCTIRMMGQVVGALIATRHATRHALLFTKMMETEKMLALKMNKGNFEAKMEISDEIKIELK